MYRCDRYDFVDFLATPLSKDWVYSLSSTYKCNFLGADNKQ